VMTIMIMVKMMMPMLMLMLMLMLVMMRGTKIITILTSNYDVEGRMPG
jgi:hypothetical protein